MKLHAALARAVADHGVDTIFGVLADPTMLFADKFVRDHGGTFISAAHEAGAVHMAYGYGVISQRLGVVSADHGPGLTNTLTAVVDSVRARAPMVLMYPDTVVVDKFYRQNVPQREFIAPTGAGFEQVRAPATALLDTAVAFRRAVSEQRPIALNIPREFLDVDIDYERTVLAETSRPSGIPDEVALDSAVGIIANAKRPVVLAGRGAVGARAELTRLAERIGAPLATTLGAKDLFRGDPFAIGIMGTLANEIAAEVLAEADCIVAFGAGLNYDTTNKGSIIANKRVVHCDIDAQRLNNFCLVEAAVLGDAAVTASTIIEWLDEAGVDPSSFRTLMSGRGLDREHQHVPVHTASKPGTVEVRAALRRIDEAVPANRIFVNDPGRHAFVSWPEVHVQDPNDFVLTAHFGAIGTGTAVAVGAAIADRSRPTLMVGGDGGFMLGGLNEFNSAVRHRVDLIAVICNDGSYGPEHQMLVQWGHSPEITEFEWPDFGPLAEALGGQGVTVRNDEGLDLACDSISKRDGPLLIDLKLDPYRMPGLPH